MTLRDFMKVLWRKLPFVIVVVLICLFVGYRAGESQFTTSYTATATVTTNISTSVATGFASNAAAAATTDTVTVTAAAVSNSASVTLTARGNDAATCVSAVNSAADSTQTQIKNGYTQSINSVRHAEKAETTTSRSPKLYAGVGLFAGIALAIIILVIWDAVTRRVHSWQTVTEVNSVRYLGSVGGSEKQQKKLASTVRLASHRGEEDADTVYFVPVGSTLCAETAVQQLSKTTDATKFVVDENLFRSEDSKRDDKRVTCSILVIEEERSTYRDLADALRDFDVAGLSPVGFIYASVWTGRKARRNARKSSQNFNPTGGPTPAPAKLDSDESDTKE